MQIEKDNPLENLQNTGQKTAINNRTEEKCPRFQILGRCASRSKQVTCKTQNRKTMITIRKTQCINSQRKRKINPIATTKPQLI
jgi:ribosome modulation factor